MVAYAEGALRRSLVYFREQLVGTIAAQDHSAEELIIIRRVSFNFFTKYIQCFGATNVYYTQGHAFFDRKLSP